MQTIQYKQIHMQTVINSFQTCHLKVHEKSWNCVKKIIIQISRTKDKTFQS